MSWRNPLRKHVQTFPTPKKTKSNSNAQKGPDEATTTVDATYYAHPATGIHRTCGYRHLIQPVAIIQSAQPLRNMDYIKTIHNHTRLASSLLQWCIHHMILSLHKISTREHQTTRKGTAILPPCILTLLVPFTSIHAVLAPESNQGALHNIDKPQITLSLMI